MTTKNSHCIYLKIFVLVTLILFALRIVCKALKRRMDRNGIKRLTRCNQQENLIRISQFITIMVKRINLKCKYSQKNLKTEISEFTYYEGI